VPRCRKSWRASARSGRRCSASCGRWRRRWPTCATPSGGAPPQHSSGGSGCACRMGGLERLGNALRHGNSKPTTAPSLQLVGFKVPGRKGPPCWLLCNQVTHCLHGLHSDPCSSHPACFCAHPARACSPSGDCEEKLVRRKMALLAQSEVHSKAFEAAQAKLLEARQAEEARGGVPGLWGCRHAAD